MIWFPELRAYALARKCPTCRARAGDPCRHNQRYPSYIHEARYEPALRHFYRDIKAAPNADDRIPGTCYCTIKPCPIMGNY